MEQLVLSDKWARNILLLTDHFTKYVEIIPVTDMTAEVCAQKMLNEFISRWGCPLSVHNDHGRTYFTKYVEIIPVPDMTAEVCAQEMLNEFISRWGCPLSVHNDQGRTYQDFKHLC